MGQRMDRRTITTRARFCGTLTAALSLVPTSASAHVSEQGFVLLLPTDLYIAGGVATVVLTVLLLALLPPGAVSALFRPISPLPSPPRWLPAVTSCISFAVVAFLILIGVTGATDPLANPLPLYVWTVWWIGLVALQGLIGNHWRYINPWTGPLAVLRVRPFLRLSRRLGHWPAVVTFLAFNAFVLADPAPSDPRRLAWIAGSYVALNFLGAVLFGLRWLVQCEGITALMRAYRRIAPLRRMGSGLALGLWGWPAARRAAPTMAVAILSVVMLACGSFDGLNETFWWLAQIGVNPLEYPGRSALVGTTLTGLAAANLALIAIFAACIWLGIRLARASEFGTAFRTFAPALLPIALGYHIAHYLTSFLVDIQWTVVATSDPLHIGADLLGLGEFYVTTGFFNTRASVRTIWLTQAGAVVIGHVVSILLAHALALRLYQDHRRATLSQIPLATLMVAYTLFGLWLLASPRGV